MLGQSNTNTIASYIKIENQDITVTQNGVYTASEEYTGLGTVTVNVDTVKNQNKTVSPTTSQQSVTPDTGYTGLGTVTIGAVTSAIDSNIQQGNIKSGVSILGVTGNYVGTVINNQDKTLSADGSYTADTGYTGLGTVTVTAGATVSSEVESELHEINYGA